MRNYVSISSVIIRFRQILPIPFLVSCGFVNEDFVILDNWLGIGNFGGFPSITIPLAFNKENKMPYGVNLMAKPYDEVNLFGIASALEEEIGLKNVSTHTINSKEGE